ncbi:inovirus-type Gp2 protein [Acinetobacter bereziniae]|uniref:inovirus-type Gp2 protein n=1 Tax=Acinetobacter bereziniae TaxID=106648 RepID=UPI00124FA6D2|nr:inovirus-type Gp2 protein [Acinetobacter bereziniae]
MKSIVGNRMLLHRNRFPDFETTSFYELCEFVSYQEQLHCPEESYYSKIIEELESFIYALKDRSKQSKTNGIKINEDFEKYIKNNLENINELMSTVNEFSPEVSLFKNRFNKLIKDNKRNRAIVSSLDLHIAELVKYLKEYLNVTKLTKEKNKLRTRIVKNRASLSKYVENLFNENSKLEVIRFEISYELNESKQDSIKIFAKYRDKLFYYLSKILLKDRLLGYIWKLQPQQQDGSISCHIILFLKAHGVKSKDYNFEMEDLKKEWSNLTDDRGGYWKCNSFFKYRSQGIGLISNLDGEKYKELKNAMKYLANPDYFIRLDLPKGIRAYGRGEIKVQAK